MHDFAWLSATISDSATIFWLVL
uniref:Uncharacterized protein n=1 Tax=Arundo donax TaxID=35708 RepID=A0A0A9E8I4_ARUDO